MAWLVGLGVIGAITYVILTAKPGPGAGEGGMGDVPQPQYDDENADGGLPMLSNKV